MVVVVKGDNCSGSGSSGSSRVGVNGESRLGSVDAVGDNSRR